MNRFGEWLREDLTRFALIIALLPMLNAVVLTVFGGVAAIVVGIFVVLVIALLAAVYVSGGSSR